MKEGNFEFALTQLIKRLVEGKSEPKLAGFCDKILYDWDQNRGKDWCKKENT